MTDSLASTMLGADSVDAIAALCERGIVDPPTAGELAGSLFTTDQPAIVRGDPSRGVVATVHGDDGGHVRLIVVDPAHRGRGYGHELLAAAEADLIDAGSVTVGADAPYYLWPGVDTRETALLCLLERRKYHRVEANFNMRVELHDLPAEPSGARRATAADREAVGAFADANYPNWRAESLRALDKGTLALSEDDVGVRALCAWDVNRRGLLGPVAVRLELIGQGAGPPVLLHALHAIAHEGRPSVDVSWVGPIVPYARVGGRVTRVFFVYRKRLRP